MAEQELATTWLDIGLFFGGWFAFFILSLVELLLELLGGFVASLVGGSR